MAKKIQASNLGLVPCNCEPDQSIGGEFAKTEYYDHPKAAALAVKRHVLRVLEGGWPYWCVHYTPAYATADFDTHVVFAVIDGLRYGPFKVTPA